MDKPSATTEPATKAAPDPDERVAEMADELEELTETIDEARRSAAADPYLEPPSDDDADVTEGEQNAP